jgi:hypothetical protein
MKAFGECRMRSAEYGMGLVNIFADISIDEVGQARSTGLEPVTQGLEIPCSIQLSYERFSTVSFTDHNRYDLAMPKNGRARKRTRRNWIKTRTQHLYRHSKSGRYYVRACRQGREVWKALGTTRAEADPSRCHIRNDTPTLIDLP